MKFYYRIFLIAVSILSMGQLNAATRSAVSSGKWEQAGTWAGGHIPACGDSIVIGSAYTVEVTTVLDFTLCTLPMQVNVSGILTFQTGKKLRLPCSSVVTINTGGSITAGNGGGNSNLIDICNITVWNAAYGTLPGYAVLQVNPLPVDLLSFYAKPERSSVKLQWYTLTEINNKWFIIEKSKDGTEFTEFTRVEGAGNSNNINSYTVSDMNPFNGIQYYRLLQQDFDGMLTVHKTVAIDFMNQTAFSIYPNPTSGDLFANIDVKLAGKTGQLVINKSDGKHLLTKEIVPGSKTYGIRLLDAEELLKPGGYLVTLNFKDQTHTQYVISR